MTAAVEHFPACELPADVAERAHAAHAAGKPLSTLVVHLRDKGATVTERGPLSGRLRRAGRHEWAQKVLRAFAPPGRVVCFVDLARGCNVTLATLPPAPVVVVQPAPADDDDVVLIPARTRVRVDRPRCTNPHPAYLRELAAGVRPPGVPCGRVP